MSILNERRILNIDDSEYLLKKETPPDTFSRIKLIQAKLNLNIKFEGAFFLMK